MAEEEIKILLEAEDRASNQLMKLQNTMLSLGHIAQSVHNIFETYQNRMRTVENAQDRVENATLRLKQAQESLLEVGRQSERNALNVKKAQLGVEEATNKLRNTIRKYGEDSIEAKQAVIDLEEANIDLKDAQQKVTDEAKLLKDKQDAVTIANNNLERSQRGLNKALGDAKWAYVDMGIQILSVGGNLSAFLKTAATTSSAARIGELASSASLASTALGPIGLAGALGALVAIPLWTHITAVSEFNKAYDDLGGTIKVTTDNIKEAHTEIPLFIDDLERMKETTGLKGTRILMANPDVEFDNKNNNFKLNQGEQQEWGLLGFFKAMFNSSKTLREKEFPELAKSFDQNLIQMKNSTFTTVSGINLSLNSIPEDIYTYHHIVTVYETAGSDKK